VSKLLEESAWFIEWSAPDAPIDTQIQLVACQRDIARWRLSWKKIWSDETRRADVTHQAGAWSRRFLNLSGLLATA
jgi:hypothetical protein